MNIGPIKNSINRAANATVEYANKVTNILMEKNFAHTMMPENPTDVAKALALASTTTKDAVNCYYYTTQSYNNKEIPEDKRKFVAGIDLANGILNVITQLTLGLVVNKQSDKLFEKIFKGGIVAKPENIAKYKQKVNALLQKSTLTKHISSTEAEIKDAIKKTNKIAKGGFGVIAVLIVTQIIAKRMIVPFLSTPLAGFFKHYLDKREQKNGIKTETPVTVDNQQSKVDSKNEQKSIVVINKDESSEHKAFKGFESMLNKSL
ncbi:unknown [Clostridium sp. CAG:306]|nr:unknown [Clostridium sp. CAG:306]